jgi:hypothetical protein
VQQRDGVRIYYRDNEGVQVVTAAATQAVADGALFRRSRVAQIADVINPEISPVPIDGPGDLRAPSAARCCAQRGVEHERRTQRTHAPQGRSRADRAHRGS